jgi:hypothetical protein
MITKQLKTMLMLIHRSSAITFYGYALRRRACLTMALLERTRVC